MFAGGRKWGVVGAWADGPVGGRRRDPLPRKALQLAHAFEARVTRKRRQPATSPRGARIAPECVRACTTPSPCRIRRTDVPLLNLTPPGM